MQTKKTLYPALCVKFLAACLCLAPAAAADTGLARRATIDLSGTGWLMWFDQKAAWQKDELFPPPVDLAEIPANPPTGGWQALNSENGLPVSVPGTAEEYLGSGPDGRFNDIKGVTWWWRDIAVPDAAAGSRVRLCFESIRLRAEVYLDEKLVGYDAVGNTPLEFDITDSVRPGASHRLAVRVTDPGGNFTWMDYDVDKWGEYTIPGGHGFGGIPGRVSLIAAPAAHIADAHIRNKPSFREADAVITLDNASDKAVSCDISVSVIPKGKPASPVFSAEIEGIELAPGISTKTIAISAPDAGLWDVENPKLHVCKLALRAENSVDETETVFGFRWFDMEGVGEDAVFRLNGKRIVLRSAISWGFWPVNGLYPTPELAEKQILAAKRYGLNMLSNHRCIGLPVLLEKADELGLLYYQEPGGYACKGGDAFSFALAREKLLRMARRDRNHPSFIIYNMINEQAPPWGRRHETDMRDAHAIDPDRIITYASAWGKPPHMRPRDDTLHTNGWVDFHNAGGNNVYCDEFHNGPEHIWRGTTNKTEIIYWGEEGANSSPPRVELIKADLDAAPRLGWDGGAYLRFYRDCVDFLDRKGLRQFFPSVDALTTAIGDNSLYYQARIIEGIRANNLVDGYVVNGWESQIFENHSGIVDCFRNPKGNPDVMAYYNRPLFVAVKARDCAEHVGGRLIFDFFLVNETGLRGPHDLAVSVVDPAGKEHIRGQFDADIEGGEVYGQLLKEGLALDLDASAGEYTVKAELRDPAGAVRASGQERVLAVDWKNADISRNGAVLDKDGAVIAFLEEEMDVEEQDNPDWVVVARPVERTDRVMGELLEAVETRGMTLIVVKGAEHWAERLSEMGLVTYSGVMKVGICWMGGGFFAREHSLFKGLPVNQGMGRPYQQLVKWDRNLHALRLEGEELVAGAINTIEPPATAVCVVKLGKGKIILSTFDIPGALAAAESAKTTHVARKLLCNYIEF